MPKTAPILGLTSALATAFFFTQNTIAANYDLLIRNGTIYDGSARAPVVGDVAVNGDEDDADLGRFVTLLAQEVGPLVRPS